MKTENALLVGGTHDGKRIEVEEGLDCISMPLLEIAPMPRRYSELSAAPVTTTFQYETYYRQPVQDENGKRHAVFALNGLNVIEELLNGYRRPK